MISNIKYGIKDKKEYKLSTELNMIINQKGKVNRIPKIENKLYLLVNGAINNNIWPINKTERIMNIKLSLKMVGINLISVSKKNSLPYLYPSI